MKTFKDLLIWQKSVILVTEIYRDTQNFPSTEVFGLTAQLRRSAISIPSNISEGYGRNTNKDFFRFISIARGSLFEFQTQIEIAKELHYLTDIQFKSISSKSRELEVMMNSFAKKLKQTFV